MAKAKNTEKKEGAPKGIAAFHDRFGANRVDPQIEVLRNQTWPTGSLVLDGLLGGGISKGRMAEIYGPPGGGKTTLAMKMVGLALGQGVPCLYLDLEHSLTISPDDLADEDKALTPEEREARKSSWLRTNGVDPNDPNFNWYKAESGEELFTMLADIVGENLFGIVIVDSVPQIMTKKQNDSDPGDATYGARAKLLSEELPRLMRLYNRNPRTTIIFINQVRENIGAQVKSQKATGGFALEHDVRIKIKIQRFQRTTKGDDVIAETRVKVEKNVFGPAREGMIRISSKRGIDTLSELVDVGIDAGLIQNTGNYYYVFNAPVAKDEFKAAKDKGKHTELPDYLVGLNGEGALLDWLDHNGWQARLYELAMQK